jgi:deoxyribonuclease-4
MREAAEGFPNHQTLHGLDALKNGLGLERAKRLHIHFSTVEFTKMGEKRHMTFSDEGYGPRFEQLAPLLAERGFEPRIICESAGTMAEDAAAMRAVFEKAQNALKT